MIQIETVNRMRPGQLIQHYLLASYCYYHLSCSPLTDSAFDQLCIRLQLEFDDIEHPHKYLITKDDLVAGTCMLAIDKFPRQVAHGAEHYYRDCATHEINARLEPLLLPASSTMVKPKRMIRTPAPSPAPVAVKRVVRSIAPAAPATPKRIVRTVRIT